MLPEVTEPRIREALATFDRDLRATTEWNGWETNRAHKFAISEGGRLYPVKQIVSMATGKPVSDFSGGDGTNRYVRELGLDVIELRRDDADTQPVSVRESIVDVLKGYSGARREPFRGDHPAYGALQKAARGLQVSSTVRAFPRVRAIAGAGKGNWARVPWVCLLDERETDTTQHGVYVVFLFRADLRGVYVTLNQGVTEPTKKLGRAAGLEQLRANARRLRERCHELEARGFRLDDEIDLAVEAGLGADYEASTIAYKYYAAEAVPDDASILGDVGALLGVYERYVSARADSVPTEVAAWIFQCNPKKWNLRGALDSLNKVRWLVAQHKERIHVGSKVYLWESGEAAGILAIGRVLTEPAVIPDLPEEAKFRVEEGKFEREAPRVEVEIVGKVVPPISRIELRTHEVLSKLAILEQPIGTNFPVTNEQAKALQELVERRMGAAEKLTFLEAALRVLRDKGSPMRVAEIWSEIERRELVETAARSPFSALSALLQRSSKGLTVSGAYPKKYFYKSGPGEFGLLEWLSDDQVRALEQDEEAVAAVEADARRELPVSAEFDRSAATETLVESIEAKGFVYEPWQVAAYVAALRTKPFVILAGVSGTGKSKLPALVSDLTGGERILVPVRPDWSDSSDVLGYVDLQGDFRPGALLQFVQTASRNTRKHHVCVVDEMNLARVEQYFAEVLSRIEDRWISEEGLPTTGPLLVQKLDTEREWAELGIPGNLAIVGTVNMDESAHGFSRKVLDRAFTMELSDVDLGSWERTEKAEPVPARWPVEAWLPRGTRLGEVDVSSEERELVNASVGALKDINQLLVQAQLQVGYRARDEIALFLLHARELRTSFVSRNGDAVDPLDLALHMKILPRIAGGSASIRNLVLQLLGWAHEGKAYKSEDEADGALASWREDWA